MRNNNALVIGAGSMALAVVLGALGAHALKGFMADGLITADQLSSFETGVRYQVYHSISLLIIGMGILPNQSIHIKWTLRLFVVGMILFSGSIYFLATRDILGAGDALKFLGPVTPIGGICLIAGWVILMLGVFKHKKATNNE